jgi:hypothetical protein
MVAKRTGTKRKYGSKASSKVGKAMHEMKRGQLRSGRSGKVVKSRKQAVAIGLSEARREGGKVPPRAPSRSKRAASPKRRAVSSPKRRAVGSRKAPAKSARKAPPAKRPKASRGSKSDDLVSLPCPARSPPSRCDLARSRARRARRPTPSARWTRGHNPPLPGARPKRLAPTPSDGRSISIGR